MKKGILILLVALLVLFIATPVLAAPATKTPFTAYLTVVSITPGKVWDTEDGIHHVKGQIEELTVTGDFQGTMVIIEDVTVDLNTGEGSAHGKWVITTSDGTFEGSFVSVITGYFDVEGTIIGKGRTGLYNGQKLKASFAGNITAPPPQATVEGIILSPKS